MDPSSVSMVYIGGVAGVELPAEREEAVVKCRVLGARYVQLFLCSLCSYVCMH